MITFDCLKKIGVEKPPIIETKFDKGFIFQYSDYCFVKNKYGYTIARYVTCEEQNAEWWDDSPSMHPLNENDEWHLLSENPIFSFSQYKMSDELAEDMLIKASRNAHLSTNDITTAFETKGLMGIYCLGQQHMLDYLGGKMFF